MVDLRDRTLEFRKTFDTLSQRRGHIGINHQKQPEPASEKNEFAEQFAEIAGRVNRDIALTGESLRQLDELASSAGLYDDKPEEIRDLTSIIKRNIPEHKKEVHMLQELVTMSGSGSGQGHLKAHAVKVVGILAKRLDVAAKEFEGVMKKRIDHLKKNKMRRDEFNFESKHDFGAVNDEMPTLLGALGNEPTTDDTVINMGPSEQALALIQNDNILEDRANTMQSIEASMLEVQDIMKDMVHVISIQGETVETLHDNVEQTEETVSNARKTLEQTLTSMRSNKWLMMKIFGILLFFFILFIVVFA
eukprot:m.37833 g.37833  ORF g.37833 m.37833 type:complete len:305 (-) comp9357_c0_seq1:1396-2310(-)